MTEEDNKNAAPAFTKLVEVSSETIGGEVLYASNEWFALAENLIKPGRGVWKEGVFTRDGKWMDGWESARHGVFRKGSEFAIIKIVPSVLHGVDIDTNHFTGNYAPFASLEGVSVEGSPPWHMMKDLKWETILPKSHLQPGVAGKGHSYFELAPGKVYTHVRLTMFPDGGIARMKLYGLPQFNPATCISFNGLVDLASVLNGGRALSCSNDFYSKPVNMLMPGRAANMGDGWESRRSRVANHKDWAVIQLGVAGTLHSIEVDTNHFRGNYPHTFSIEYAFCPSGTVQDSDWKMLVKQRPGKSEFRMILAGDDFTIGQQQLVSHLRLCTYPDGGVSRLRVWGVPQKIAKL